jgi:hypothetical protein
MTDAPDIPLEQIQQRAVAIVDGQLLWQLTTRISSEAWWKSLKMKLCSHSSQK